MDLNVFAVLIDIPETGGCRAEPDACLRDFAELRRDAGRTVVWFPHVQDDKPLPMVIC